MACMAAISVPSTANNAWWKAWIYEVGLKPPLGLKSSVRFESQRKIIISDDKLTLKELNFIHYGAHLYEAEKISKKWIVGGSSCTVCT